MSLRTRVALLVAGLSLVLSLSLGGYLWHAVRHASTDALDRELATSADVLARLVHLDDDGDIELEDHGTGDLEIPYRLETPEGRVIAQAGLRWPALHEVPRGESTTVWMARGRPYRVLTRALALQRHGRSARVVLRVAVSAAPTMALRRQVGRAVLTATVASALLGALAAALVARSTTRPLRSLADQVTAIEPGALDRRIAVAGRDREVVALAGAFDGLLRRLQAAFERQRAFVARASHALRTPTATILTRAEVTLARPRDEAAYRAALEEIAGAARESAALVQHLLALARLDERATELHPEPVALDVLAEDLERLLAPRARAAGVSLSFDVAPDAHVRADRAALREMLEALLDNALRYTPRGGTAGLRAANDALTVWDTGPGMTDEDKRRAFERFFRGSAAERSGAPGSGLGMAIARAVAERHGGTIELADREGGGLEVRVRWP